MRKTIDVYFSGSSIGPEAISSGRRGLSSSASKPGKPPTEGSPSPAHSPHVENVIASCAGFPKDMLNGPSTVQDKGVFGDDAWFISRFKNTFVVGKLDIYKNE